MKLNYTYIKINNDKVPLNTLDKTFTYDEIKNDEAVAILVKEPFVVLDLDNIDHFECLYRIVQEKGIKCRIMKSTRGGHFWFKVPEPIPNRQNANTPLTLKADIKCSGKKSMVTIKKNGRWREWLKEDEEVDELPFWLRPLKYNKDLYDLADGDGRDSQLFSYIIPLIKNGFTKDQIHELFNMINQYVFAEPLTQKEVDKMFTTNDIFEEKKLQFFKGKEFLHNIFADYIIEKYNVKSYSGQPCIYDDGVYSFNQDIISRHMIENISNLKRQQLSEAFENLRLKVTQNNEKLDPFMVNLKNGMYDIKTNKLLPHTPDLFSINQLNCSFDENAYDANVDKMLDNVTENNANLRNLIEEMLGYFLLGDCRYQKAFILLGGGSNGKSAFLKMVTTWIGTHNCAKLSLENLNDKFKSAELVGKVVNIGDDINNAMIKDSSIFKKVVTGDGITVERKNKDPFVFNNSAKLIFSANNLPPSSDKSHGFFRRMVIIPFNAVFDKNNKNFDPNIEDKITCENARNYLLLLALKGLNRIIANKGINVPEEVQAVIRKYEIDNNSVLQWIEDNLDNIEGRLQQEVFTDYCLFCENNNQKAVQLRKFNTEIINRNSNFELRTKDSKVYWYKKTD